MNPILAQLMNSAGFSIDNFLNGLNKSIDQWASVLVVIIGMIMVVVAIFNIAKGLMSGGRGQVNWVLNLILFFVGGAIAFAGGWSTVSRVAGGGADTLNAISDRGTGATTIVVDAESMYDTISIGDFVISFE